MYLCKINGSATVDEKPLTLILREARGRGRAPTPGPSQFNGGFPDMHYGSNMVPQQYYFPQPYSGQPFLQCPAAPIPTPALASALPTLPVNAAPSVASSTSNPTSTQPAIPDIMTWCHYLDRHQERNNDGIQFGEFGPLLKQKGYLRISQLASDFYRDGSLEKILGVEEGIAIMIRQYAKEDLDEIRAGKLVIPRI
jgi:hypothetical protein